MRTLYVKAAPGLKFMVEGKPKTPISGTTPIAVPASHYYYKAINDGDLIQLNDQEWAEYQASRNNPQPVTTPAPAPAPVSAPALSSPTVVPGQASTSTKAAD